MVFEELDKWADDKGILVMGTGDFTHPAWIKDIKDKLETAEPGLFKLKPNYKKETIKGTKADTRFLLTVEISSIYSKNGKTYRVHNLILAPDIKTAEKINTQLSLIGNIVSDGRPILGLNCEELAKIVFNINPEAVIIPAHAWTPWFSIFGSMSGFNSIDECFGKYADKIFAIETGLSSDPAMNWRLSKLDKIALISNSDSHSPSRIGREANVFEGNSISYYSIINAVRNSRKLFRESCNNEIEAKQNVNSREDLRLAGTIEFYPEEGKYHYDGHRLCKIVFSPEETKESKNICPKCGRPLVIGVMSRVDQLADRQEGFMLENAPAYRNLVPLDQIIAEALGKTLAAKAVSEEYRKLINIFGNEIKILMDVSSEDFKKEKINPNIIEGIKRVREGNLNIRPGYDGEYGQVCIFNNEKAEAGRARSLKNKGAQQNTLF